MSDGPHLGGVSKITLLFSKKEVIATDIGIRNSQLGSASGSGGWEGLRYPVFLIPAV